MGRGGVGWDGVGRGEVGWGGVVGWSGRKEGVEERGRKARVSYSFHFTLSEVVPVLK
jgi:hypothetical protein